MITTILFAAAAVETQVSIPVKDKPVANIEAGQTYLMVRASGASGAFATPIAFFLEPNANDVSDYNKRRSQAFAKSTWQVGKSQRPLEVRARDLGSG